MFISLLLLDTYVVFGHHTFSKIKNQFDLKFFCLSQIHYHDMEQLKMKTDRSEKLQT